MITRGSFIVGGDQYSMTLVFVVYNCTSCECGCIMCG